MVFERGTQLLSKQLIQASIDFDSSLPGEKKRGDTFPTIPGRKVSPSKLQGDTLPGLPTERCPRLLPICGC